MQPETRRDLVILATVTLVLLAINLNVSYLRNLDALKFAQSAVQWNKGAGFTTKMVMPSQAPSVLPSGAYPRRSNKPLWVITVAGFFKTFGTTLFNLRLLSSLFLLPLVLLTYFSGRKLFDRRVGLLAALLVATNYVILRISVSGRTEPMFDLFMLLHLFFFLRSERLRGLLLASGALLLAIYTRPNSFVFIVPFATIVLLHPLWRANRAKHIAAIVGLALAVTPLFVWNAKNYGSAMQFYANQPFALGDALESGAMAGETTQSVRYMDDRPVYGPADLLLEPGRVLRTLKNHLKYYSGSLWVYPNPLIGIAFLLAFLQVRLSGRAGWMLFCLLLYDLLILGSTVFTAPLMRYFSFNIPIMAILAAAFLLKLAEQSGMALKKRAVVFGLLGMMLLVQLFSTFQYQDKADQLDFRRKVGQLVNRYCEPNAVVVTDVPAIVAWASRNTERLSFFIPESLEHLDKLGERHPFDYLLITLGEWIRPDEREFRSLFFSPKDNPGLKLVAVANSETKRRRYAVLYRVDKKAESEER